MNGQSAQDLRAMWLISVAQASRACGGILIELTRATNSPEELQRSQAFHALVAVGEAMMMDNEFRNDHAMPAIKNLLVEIDRRQRAQDAAKIVQVQRSTRIITPGEQS